MNDTVVIEILTIQDKDSWEDLPWSYTARIMCGSPEKARAMLEGNLGGTDVIDAFSICVVGDIIEFCAFNRVEVGASFTLEDAVEKAKAQRRRSASIRNELDRLITCALLDLYPVLPMYSRGFWWEHLHADPALKPLNASCGNVVQIGQRCRFRREQEDDWEEGWIKYLGDHLVRPIGVCEMGRIGMGGLGCKPSDVQVVADPESVAFVMPVIRDLVENKMAVGDFIGVSQMHYDTDLQALLAVFY